MTVVTVHTARCDAPRCPANQLVARVGDIPQGWRRLDSATHTAGADGGYLDHTGAWALLLCPRHRDVFNGHLPQSRSDGVTVAVSCSCRAEPLGTVTAGWTVRQLPAGNAEHCWWTHLPPALRWYAAQATAE